MRLRRSHKKQMALKNDGPFKVLQVKNYMVTIDVNGIYNAVSINRIALTKTAEEAM